MEIVKRKANKLKEAWDSTPAIAIIGCGAIVESFHLPALSRHTAALERAILVDRDVKRAKNLASVYGIAEVATDYLDVVQRVNGVIVATPHHLHHSIVLDCIRRGIHVLCEKPLAETAAHVQEIIQEGERSGVTVSVNNTRRLYPASRRVQQLIAQGDIGRPISLDFSEGEEYGWPSASGFYFGSRGSAKGVLLDRGAHVLDLVCWWLGAKPRLISYEDDSFGGSEAVAKLTFEFGDCRGKVHLSWLSKLKNSFRIQGESGSIEGGIYDWRTLRISSRSGKEEVIRANTECREISDLSRLLIDNFLNVITQGAPPLVSPGDVSDSIALIEECYARRARFAMPWHDALYRIAS